MTLIFNTKAGRKTTQKRELEFHRVGTKRRADDSASRFASALTLRDSAPLVASLIVILALEIIPSGTSAALAQSANEANLQPQPAFVLNTAKNSLKSVYKSEDVSWKPGRIILNGGWVQKRFDADGLVTVHLNLSEPKSADDETDPEFRVRIVVPDAFDVLVKFTTVQVEGKRVTKVSVVQIANDDSQKRSLVRQTIFKDSLTSLSVQYRYGQVVVHAASGLVVVAHVTNGDASVDRVTLLAPNSKLDLHGMKINANKPVSLDDNTNLQLQNAQTLQVAGRQAMKRRDWDAAIKAFEQSLLQMKSVLGENHFRIAVALKELGRSYLLKGDKQNAHKALQQSIEMATPLVGDVHEVVSDSVRILAEGFEQRSELPAALRNYQVARFKYGFVRGDQHLSVIELDAKIAELIGRMGDFSAAEVLLQQAMDKASATSGETTLAYAKMLDQMTRLCLSFQRLEKAEKSGLRAEEMRRRLQGENHGDYGTTIGTLASIYRQQARLPEALTLSEKALAIARKSSEQPTEYADRASNLGLIYENLGRYADAEKLYEECLEIREKTVGRLHSKYAITLRNLAGLYESMGQPDRATELFEQASLIVRDEINRGAAYLTDFEQHLMEGRFRSFLDTYVSNTIETGADAEPLLHAVWLWKGAITVRQMAKLAVAEDPQLKLHFDAIKDVNRRITEHSRQMPQKKDNVDQVEYERLVEEWGQSLDQLYSERSDAESKIARQARTASVGRQTVHAIRERLPKNAAFVDFLEYNHASTKADAKGHTDYERRYVAFIVTDRSVDIVPIGSTEEIDSAITTFRAVIHGQLSPDDLQKSSVAIKRLQLSVWSPIRDKLLGAELVIVSPDMTVGTLPFAALPNPVSDSFLIEDFQFISVPIAQMLSSLPERKSDPESSLLVVGDIDYQGGVKESSSRKERGETQPTAQSIARSLSRDEWNSLPGFRAESTIVTDLFDNHVPQGRRTSLTAASATEAAFLQLADKHSILHVVTHGYFEKPATNDLARSQIVSRLLPTYLSGLAFAGANRPYSNFSDGQDGLLRATEIESFMMPDVDLVVLSACETGLGKPTRGAGLMGLQRAFHVAGARSVVASLWRVDDRATQELMKKFYTNLWVHRQSKADALRNAQLWILNHPDELSRMGVRDVTVRGRIRNTKPTVATTREDASRKRTSPYFWAPWLLSGDWR